jgi:hypothetical protein
VKRDIERAEKQLAELKKKEDDKLKAQEQEQERHRVVEQAPADLVAFIGKTFQPIPQLQGVVLGKGGWVTSDVLRLCDACCSFHKVIGMTPFEVEQLIGALLYRKGEV